LASQSRDVHHAVPRTGTDDSSVSRSLRLGPHVLHQTFRLESRTLRGDIWRTGAVAGICRDCERRMAGRVVRAPRKDRRDAAGCDAGQLIVRAARAGGAVRTHTSGGRLEFRADAVLPDDALGRSRSSDPGDYTESIPRPAYGNLPLYHQPDWSRTGSDCRGVVHRSRVPQRCRSWLVACGNRVNVWSGGLRLVVARPEPIQAQRREGERLERPVVLQRTIATSDTRAWRDPWRRPPLVPPR